jgi:A/G-specific adenine glycosylase
MTEPARDSFAARLLDWHARAGRHDLPWQTDRSAYRTWVAEIMLQQTQVTTVVPYFNRFIERFSDIAALAAAPLTKCCTTGPGLATMRAHETSTLRRG